MFITKRYFFSFQIQICIVLLAYLIHIIYRFSWIVKCTNCVPLVLVLLIYERVGSESFFRGGPTLNTLIRGESNKIPL